MTNEVKLKLLKSILHNCFNIGTLYLQDQNQPVCKLWNEIEIRFKSQKEKEKERKKERKKDLKAKKLGIQQRAPS